MPSLEEIQAQLSYEVAVYREQMTMLKRETERVSMTSMDLSNALKTVQNLDAHQVMIPIGGGALIRGTVSATDVLLPVGSGYVLQLKKDAAAAELSKRIDATNHAVERLTQEFNKLNEKLRSLSGQLSQLEMQSKIDQNVEENIRDDYL